MTLYDIAKEQLNEIIHAHYPLNDDVLQNQQKLATALLFILENVGRE